MASVPNGDEETAIDALKRALSGMTVRLDAELLGTVVLRHWDR